MSSLLSLRVVTFKLSIDQHLSYIGGQYKIQCIVKTMNKLHWSSWPTRNKVI